MGFRVEREGPKRSSRMSPKVFLFVAFDAAAEGAGNVFYLGDGGVYGGAVFGGGFGLDKGLKSGAEPLLARLNVSLNSAVSRGGLRAMDGCYSRGIGYSEIWMRQSVVILPHL